MYDWVKAFRYEAEAVRTRAGGPLSGVVSRITASDLAASYKKALEWAGQSKAGAYVGAKATDLSRFLGRLPLISFTADAIRQANCQDLLVADVKRDGSALACVRLAEALDTGRRDAALLRGVRSFVDPAGFVAGAALREAAQLGKDGPPLTERLARRAYTLVLKQDPRSFERLWVLARIYLLAGKPGLAVQYAIQAARVCHEGRARRTLDEIGNVTESAIGRWALRSLAKGRDSVSKRLTGEPYLADTEVRLRRGAAYVTAAWAFRALGDLESARRFAAMANDLGFTLGHEVLAATLESDDGFPARILHRHQELSQVNPGDVRFYAGHYRGTVMGTNTTMLAQLKKFGDLLSSKKQ